MSGVNDCGTPTRIAKEFMSDPAPPFSVRHGYKAPEIDIVVREDAPDELRGAIILLAYKAGLQPSALRSEICEVLLRRPDQNNWSEYPNIAWEVDHLINGAPWYKVYDIAEHFYSLLDSSDPFQREAASFETRLNEFMREHGIGWQMQSGQIVARGSEAFLVASQAAVSVMRKTGRTTAAREMHEALSDLSRRPNADVTGAIQHAMTALECVARDMNASTDTLGRIIPKLGLPKPMDSALEKMWGFASEQGRHMLEGRNPSFEEAEVVVTVASAISVYLLRVGGGQNPVPDA